MAAIVAAATEPEVAVGQEELARSAGSPAAASVLGRTLLRLDRHTAAAANGLAICWTEFDEGYRLVACHAGANIIPAMLAEADATDPDGNLYAAMAPRLAPVERSTCRWGR
jgi:2-methylcitrate dehydratase PrpD